MLWCIVKVGSGTKCKHQVTPTKCSPKLPICIKLVQTEVSQHTQHSCWKCSCSVLPVSMLFILALDYPEQTGPSRESVLTAAACYHRRSHGQTQDTTIFPGVWSDLKNTPGNYSPPRAAACSKYFNVSACQCKWPVTIFFILPVSHRRCPWAPQIMRTGASGGFTIPHCRVIIKPQKVIKCWFRPISYNLWCMTLFLTKDS